MFYAFFKLLRDYLLILNYIKAFRPPCQGILGGFLVGSGQKNKVAEIRLFQG